MFYFDKGIKINGSSLWLDASCRVDSCFVSHGHLDHARKHRLVLATDITSRILHQRIGATETIPLNYREPYEFECCRITLFPAGHILGSSQILVEVDDFRLLYSGDFNLQKSVTAEPIDIPESDILIMECTFGSPFYRFPERSRVEDQLINFVAQSLNQGSTPVIIAYVLGKSQEAMKILGDAGFELSVHGSIARLARIYEEFGVEFGKWQKFSKKDIDGKVLIMPRKALQSRVLEKIANTKTVFLSGWALNRSTKYRLGVDEALPLSDHSDFNGLIEYVRRVNPKKIYTTHGFSEFPRYLRRLGFNAEPLTKVNQLSLF